MLATLTDVIFEPRQAFARAPNRHPWVWALCLVIAIGATAPMSIVMYSPRGQQVVAEGQQKEFESVRSRFSERQYEQILRNGEILRERIWFEYGLRNTFVNVAFMTVVSWLVWYLFAPFAPVRAAFVQVLGVVALASVVFVIEALYISVFDAVVGTVSLRADLETILPFGLPAMAGKINPFTLWWMVLVSTGLARLHSARMRMFILPLVGLYAVALIVSSTGLSLGSGAPDFHRRG